MSVLNIDLTYKPRWYQHEFEQAMLNGKNRALLVWHRRCGKDLACLNFLVTKMLETVGVYYYFFPTFRQARAVIWDGLDEEGNRLINAFPKEIVDGKPNETQMKIRLINGSVFQLIGTDNFDSIAGTNPCGCVFSEYALQDPTCWTLIIRPILLKNGGWAVFNGTPRGKNHQWDLDIIARDNPKNWFYQHLSNDDTHIFTTEQLDEQRREGVSEEIIQQEYFCSYERGIEGGYYTKLMWAAQQEKRIGNVPYEPRSNVNTAWDIGFGDSTSIIFWQQIGAEVRIIDFYESQGEGLAHYAKVIQSKPYVYGTHYFPHDAGSGSAQTGKTYQQVANELAIQSVILPRDDLQVGIEAARALIPMCYFDELKCKHLIKCLYNYHKKFNETMNCYSMTPVHDWSSHAADAFRYLSIARQHFGKGPNNLSAEKIREMRMRNYGY